MKVFKANNELAKILLNNGFEEISSKRDTHKGKRGFRITKNSRKEIYFDYINIRILNSIHGMDSCLQMSENELRLLILYFKLSSQDRKIFTSGGLFNFQMMVNGYTALGKELERLREFELHRERQKKIEQIIEIYKNIEL